MTSELLGRAKVTVKELLVVLLPSNCGRAGGAGAARKEKGRKQGVGGEGGN